MLEQILLNLAVNAKDAMPSGGRLDIEAKATELGGTLMGHQASLPAGSYATLEVADTGTGMDESVLGHLFEPFFTTKEKGTGLGLSTTYGLVRQSGGEILVDSRPGRGTAFTIHLPLAREAPAAAAGARREAPKAAAGERVLVVDDEEMVRTLVGRILGTAGYGTVMAASGEEALEVWKREGGRFDLLLTDVVMPGMNGLDLAHRLKEEAPGLPVLVITGYTADVDVGGFAAPKEFRFLGKPFTPELLLRNLEEVLAQAHRT
jgi:CheY-like chemotaxis protein